MLKMSDICVSLKRANPAILRFIRMSETYTAEDFAAAVMIAFGIKPAEIIKAGFELEDGSIYEDGLKEISLREILKCGSSGEMKLRWLLPEREFEFIFREFETGASGLSAVPAAEANIPDTAETAAVPQPQDTDRSLPEVLLAKGMNIPEGRYDIRALNRAAAEFERIGSCSMPDGRYISQSMTAFSASRTENAMKKYFMPGTAAPEINHDLSVPAIVLLSSVKMQELREIADRLDMYSRSNRKAELIFDIVQNLEHSRKKSIFDEISLEEYYSFRKFVTSDERTLAAENFKIEEKLPAFYQYGFVLEMPKSGARIASELLDYYSEWFNTDIEKQFVNRKHMETAMKACIRLYGIFSLKMFKAVLEKLLEENGMPPEERVLEKFFNEAPSVYRSEKLLLSAQKHRLLYSGKLVEKKEASAYQQVFNEDIFRVPEAEEILDIAKNGVQIGTELKKFLLDTLNKYKYYGYYTYETPEDDMRDVIMELQKGRGTEGAFNMLCSKAYRIRYSGVEAELIRSRLAELVSKENNIPRVFYEGYSVKDCPEELKAAVQEMLTVKTTGSTGTSSQRGYVRGRRR